MFEGLLVVGEGWVARRERRTVPKVLCGEAGIKWANGSGYVERFREGGRSFQLRYRFEEPEQDAPATSSLG
jgi:hypothetical protein